MLLQLTQLEDLCFSAGLSTSQSPSTWKMKNDKSSQQSDWLVGLFVGGVGLLIPMSFQSFVMFLTFSAPQPKKGGSQPADLLDLLFSGNTPNKSNTRSENGS